MIEVSEVRELAVFRGDPIVTSLYVDVDGRRYPRPSDVDPRIDHLVRLARTQAEPLGKEVANAVEADLLRIREWLAAGIDRRVTRGLAAFSCNAQNFFRTFELPVSVHDHVGVSPAPDVAGLCKVLASDEHALVVVTDRHRSRLLRLDPGETHELEGPVDKPARQVDTDVELGSFERHHEEAARRHLSNVARAVLDELKERPVERIVLGGPADIVGQLRGELPRGVREHVTGTIKVAVNAPVSQVAGAAIDVVRHERHRRQAALVEEVRGRAQQGAGAVSGLTATLGVLRAGRVGVLLVSRDLEASGGRCPGCMQLVADGLRCPVCGERPIVVDDVVAPAIAQACAQRAEVEFCEPAALDAMGGIGAIERY
ncbi:MAG TPA: hypothetical protein VMV22_13625 [Acidimicrobiales bacterium]|nr:hypothetical protein [Acidimicrobiales bacterium]